MVTAKTAGPSTGTGWTPVARAICRSVPACIGNSHDHFSYSTISQGEPPLITITRRLAQQLRSVLRRAFGNFRGNGPAIGFIAGKEGLTVKSMLRRRRRRMSAARRTPAETIWLPFEFLADVAGKNDEPVDLEATGDGQVSVQWRTGNVPQIVKYDAQGTALSRQVPCAAEGVYRQSAWALAGFARGIGSH